MVLLHNLLAGKDGIYQFTTDAKSISIEYSMEYQGMPITIENPVNSTRSGVDKDGHDWTTRFFYPYGYISDTEGADQEGIDVFIGPDPFSSNVYVINQKIDGKFDESKCMLEFGSEEAVRDAYLAHYDTQKHLGPIKMIPIDEFKRILNERNGKVKKF